MPIALLTRSRIDDVSRRRFLAGAAGLAALLAGCGPASSPAVSGAAAGFPRTLPGKEGQATIPSRPERVVAVGFQRDADTVLSLGVQPSAIPANTVYPGGLAPWVEAALGQPRPEVLDVTTGLPFERIAGLRPDLIVATDDYELADNRPRLVQIAPTLSYLVGPEADTWQQRTRHVGAALGLDEESDGLVAEVEAMIDRAAAAHPAFAGRTFSRSYVYEGEIRALTGTDASIALLERLGLTHSPAVAALPQNETPGRASVSPENLAVLDADVMMVSFVGDGQQAVVESNPLFGVLRAVREGRYIRVDQPTSAALAFPSPLSIPYGLDRTVAAIAAVLR